MRLHDVAESGSTVHAVAHRHVLGAERDDHLRVRRVAARDVLDGRVEVDLVVDPPLHELRHLRRGHRAAAQGPQLRLSLDRIVLWLAMPLAARFEATSKSGENVRSRRAFGRAVEHVLGM